MNCLHLPSLSAPTNDRIYTYGTLLSFRRHSVLSRANSSDYSHTHFPSPSQKHLPPYHPQTLSDSFPKALNKQTSWAHETSVSAFLFLLLSCFLFSGFLVLWSLVPSRGLYECFLSTDWPWNHLQYVPRDCDSDWASASVFCRCYMSSTQSLFLLCCSFREWHTSPSAHLI